MAQRKWGGVVASLLTAGLLGAAALGQGGNSPSGPKPEDQVLAVLDHYRAAMENKSLKDLGEVMDPNLLIYEGLHKNDSWENYKDRHIGEHFKEWKSLKIEDPRIVEISVSGDLAYAVQTAVNKVVTEDGKERTSDSVQTFVFRKSAQGWRIKYIHAFSKPR